MLFMNLNLTIIERNEGLELSDYVIRVTNINTNKYKDFTHNELTRSVKNDEYVLTSCLESLYNSYYTYYEECIDVYDFIYNHMYDDEEEGFEAYEITKQDATNFNDIVDTETLSECEKVFDL